MSFNTLAVVDESKGTGKPNSLASSQGRSELQFRMFGIYGFISRPPVDSLAVLLPLNADPSNCVGIVDDLDQGKMPELEEGECAFGVYASGSYIHFKNDGTIVIKGKIVHEGDTEQTGGQVASGDVVAGGISLQGHTHGGVKSGGDSTGAPE